jgi:hypothetical protein
MRGSFYDRTMILPWYSVNIYFCKIIWVYEDRIVGFWKKTFYEQFDRSYIEAYLIINEAVSSVQVLVVHTRQVLVVHTRQVRVVHTRQVLVVHTRQV